MSRIRVCPYPQLDEGLPTLCDSYNHADFWNKAVARQVLDLPHGKEADWIQAGHDAALVRLDSRELTMICHALDREAHWCERLAVNAEGKTTAEYSWQENAEALALLDRIQAVQEAAVM